MSEKQLKVEEFLWTTIVATIMFLALDDFWMMLEKSILGSVENNVIDNVIAIPIFISLWFNARGIMQFIITHSK